MNLQTFVYQQAGNAIAAEIACMGGPDAFFEKLQKGRQQLPLKYRSIIQQHAAMTRFIWKERKIEHGRDKEHPAECENDAEDL